MDRGEHRARRARQAPAEPDPRRPPIRTHLRHLSRRVWGALGRGFNVQEYASPAGSTPPSSRGHLQPLNSNCGAPPRIWTLLGALLAGVVRVMADDGAAGWGEATPTLRWNYETAETIVSTLKGYIAPVLTGLDAWDL